jgi:hypothetical protein
MIKELFEKCLERAIEKTPGMSYREQYILAMHTCNNVLRSLGIPSRPEEYFQSLYENIWRITQFTPETIIAE